VTSAVKTEGFDYSSAIDPSLGSSDSSSTQDTIKGADPKFVDNSHLRGASPSYSVPTPSSAHMLDTYTHSSTPAKKMKIDEIIGLMGPTPPLQGAGQSKDKIDEITTVYHNVYAPGLVSFFETRWYQFKDQHGKNVFPTASPLIDQFATFLDILAKVRANDHTQMVYSGVLETRIVWALASLVYTTPSQTNAASFAALPADNDSIEARNRLLVVETLLCGDYLETNPLAPVVNDANPHRMREFGFWHTLAEFVRVKDGSGKDIAQRRNDVLGELRNLLDGRENRDVLYSIAIARELAPQFEPGYENTIPQHVTESDPKHKLWVASKFIQDEAQVTGGTTNVVRRFSDIAARAFINPGVNIARRAP
jgi:white-opaque regulator 2